jgi:hypothetical protein
MHRRPRLLTAALVVSCTVGVAAAQAAAMPEWAKPYVSRPVPQGSFVGDSEWVALYSEVEIGAQAAGLLRRTYRQVLAPVGGKPRLLRLGVAYDRALQELKPPQVWVRGAHGTIRLELSESTLDVPGLLAPWTTSQRLMLSAIASIAPEDRVILQWEVNDREPLPGGDVLWPFDVYPSAEFVVRAAPSETGGMPPKLFWVEPGEGEGAPAVREGDVVLHEVPAIAAVYGQDPWLSTPLEALPHMVIHRGPGKPEWPALAAEAAALFRGALAAEPRTAWTPTAARLATGGGAVQRMAAFVQSLTYRNVAWGEGAYRPEPPGETLRTRSADCKGKVLLLQTLLSEANVESVPVLCQAGPAYQGEPAVPTLRAFDHVVLAVRLPGAETWPGALVDGPGQGWVLFDPTDSVAVFGLPPSNLQGRSCLWLGPEGRLFPVHTRQPGCRRVEVALDVKLACSGEARFDLKAAGESPLARDHRPQEDAESFRQSAQQALGQALPGAVLSEAVFQEPDHEKRQPPHLEIRGTIPEALLPVGGDLYTFPAPAALVGQALGIPALPKMNTGDAPSAWQAEPRFQGESICLQGEVSLSLPAGWSVAARPEMHPIAAPWLAAGTAESPAWKVTVEIPRGRFAAGAAHQRLSDLNALATLFRQPFLLHRPDRACQ